MSDSKFVVAIVGGAVAGSEAARVLAERGVICVVIEQNPRPFGKIEDGLPRWHVKQRRNEYVKIGEKLSDANIHFVPRTAIGPDISFEDLMSGWGFSAVLLANGAWRDRGLEIDGVDEYVDKGLVYQNPFVYWFNHFVEASYDGPQYPILENTGVIGGGLASIDVVKILQIELVRRAAKEKKGLDLDMHELEKKGVVKSLEAHGLKYEDLGVTGCTLYYRRRPLDMPLAEYPEGATDEQKEKTHAVREKILNKVKEKFLIDFQECHLPKDKVVEDGRLVGIEMLRTRIEGRKVIPLEGSEVVVRHPMFISSIGSVPAEIDGLRMRGEYYEVEDWDTGKIGGFESLWGLGNVVTGKGNIKASLQHGQYVAEHVARSYLGLDGEELDRDDLYKGQEDAAAEAAGKIADQLANPLAPEAVAAILDRVKARQAAVGYEGDLEAWLEKVTPSDME